MRLPYARPVLPGARFLRLVRRKRFFEAPLRISGVAKGRAYGLRGPCKGLLLAYGSKRTDFPFSPARKPTAIVSAQGPALAICRWQPAPPGAGAKAFTGHHWPRRRRKGTLPFSEKRYPGKAGKTANRAEYREKLRQAKIITPGRAGMQNAARPKRVRGISCLFSVQSTRLRPPSWGCPYPRCCPARAACCRHRTADSAGG